MDAEWVSFFSVPGILLLRLMSRCNEKCLFCMVEEEIEKSVDVPYDQVVNEIDKQKPGTLIEFFGGEPTIYPQFLELVEYSRTKGFDCTIASNCRVFHSKKFTDRFAQTGTDHLYVRTSMYGHNRKLHDYYTATPFSFSQTVKGLENLVEENILTQVNIVIMEHNLDHLSSLVKLVHSIGVPKIKFGNLIYLSTCHRHAVKLSTVTQPLKEAIMLAESLGLEVTVEKTPICVASGRIDLLSTESEAFGSNRAFDDDGACKNCLVRRWCDGVDPDYVEHFGFDGLNTVVDVPANGIHSDLSVLPEPELLKTYCVSVPNETQLDQATLIKLESVYPKVAKQYGRFAIFPQQYIRAE